MWIRDSQSLDLHIDSVTVHTLTNTAVFFVATNGLLFMTSTWISNHTAQEMLCALPSGWQRSLHTLFSQRTQSVCFWLILYSRKVYGCILCSLCWIGSESCRSDRRDSPASSLCSCDVWSPSRLMLWLRCVCGNSCWDLCVCGGGGRVKGSETLHNQIIPNHLFFCFKIYAFKKQVCVLTQ